MHTDDLIQRERELELKATTIGESRIAEAVKRNGLTGTAGGKSLIVRSIDSYVRELENWMDSQKDKKRKPPCYKFMEALPLRDIAYLVMRQMFNKLNGDQHKYDQMVRSLAATIGKAIGASLFEQQDKEGFEDLVRRLDWQPRAYIRERMAEEVFTNNCIEIVMQPQEELALGTTLLEIFVEVTGLFTIRIFNPRPEHSLKVIAPTDKAADWLREADQTNMLAMPFNLPMVIPPFPWTTLNDGGYLLQNLHPLELVRKVRENQHTLQTADLSRVQQAVNSIQETPWRINMGVYDVWQSLLGTGLAGCSQADKVYIPDALDPEDEGYATRNNERRDAFQYIQDNQSKVLSEAQKSRFAELMVEEQEFYYPHNVDFRGRIYPACGVGSINPQGDDSGKALIEFAEGKALGEDGLQWLYIHTQNVWGNDKVSLQDRITATEDRLEEYYEYALHPLDYTGWMEADKPFCFLACCFELLEIGNLRDCPEIYESHLPIALDGSCSGLQHFAGMLLDESLAKAVNVIQEDELPKDIYSMVADVVEDAVSVDFGEEGKYWHGKVSRDIVKQPVMTLAYGVSKSGMRSQVIEKCKKLARKGHTEYKKGATSIKDEEGNVVISFAGYLADCIHGSIANVSTAAYDVMEWLSDVAEAKAKVHDETTAGALSWTSPIGLPILQEYYEYDTQRLNVYFEGRRIRFSQRTGAAVVNVREQKQGAAPNFVHSMDAAHLMLTVNECTYAGIGIDSFAMIHDSFGTHAADTPALFEILREQFHLMYREDALMHLYADLTPEAQEICGLPPVRGGLDLSLVQESEYFFS